MPISAATGTPQPPRPAPTPLGRYLAGQDGPFRLRLGVTYAVLMALNLGAWAAALASFRHQPGLLGIALVTYGLGLRHAVDADHIAAIDNVTRKLMQSGQRPVGVGFFFAIGHASIVMLVTATVAGAVSVLGAVQDWQSLGGIISTGVSVIFLLAVAAMNLRIFFGIYASYRRIRAGLPWRDEDLDTLLAGRGLLCRLLRPIFGMITQSWQMLALGVLFGLGFDTATEVAVFGVSAAQNAQGLPLAGVLLFPLLFAAGMTLVDTTDGVMMLGLYDWAIARPLRRVVYNMAITGVSVVVALVVGGVEALGLIRQTMAPEGSFWDAAGSIAGDMNLLGMLTIALFVASWLISLLIHKARGPDTVDR
jgi:high-affinity nickel-transport protein